MTKEIMEGNCFKCGVSATEKRLWVHHLSYKPEKTIACCASCHVNLHQAIRLSFSNKTILCFGTRLTSISYAKRNIHLIGFTETIASKVRLHELIHYNEVTGNLNYCSYFELR